MNTGTTTAPAEISPLAYLAQIPDYDGRKEDLNSFTAAIDNILPVITTYSETSQKMLLTIIKGKVKGKAKTALDIHPHLTTWTEIKKMLETNFGGLSSPEHLYEELRNAQYRGDVLTFYNYILSKLALLNQRNKMDGRLTDIPHNNRAALRVFINKLPVNLRTVLCALKPLSLEMALHELATAGLLHTTSQNSGQGTRKPTGNQTSTMNGNQATQPRTNAFPANHQQQRPQGQPQQNQWRPQHHHQQQWQPRQPAPEPMDISQQTKQNFYNENINNNEYHNNNTNISKYPNNYSHYLGQEQNINDNSGYEHDKGQVQNFHFTASAGPPDVRHSCPMFSSGTNIEQHEC